MADTRAKCGSSGDNGCGAAYRRRRLKHAMLTGLGPDALKSLADDLELAAHRRSVDQMRQVLSRYHRVTSEYLAEALYETDAKAVCESLGIDSKGRRQAVIQRLLESVEGTSTDDLAEPKRPVPQPAAQSPAAPPTVRPVVPTRSRGETRLGKTKTGGKPSANKHGAGNGANLGFETKMWLAADKLRSNNHIVLGLFLRNCVVVALKETWSFVLIAEERNSANG